MSADDSRGMLLSIRGDGENRRRGRRKRGWGMRNEGNNRIYSFFFFPWHCNLMPECLGMVKRGRQQFQHVSLHKYKCMNVFMRKVHAPVCEPVAKAKSNWFECFWEIFSSVLRRSPDDYWLVNWLIGIRRQWVNNIITLHMDPGAHSPPPSTLCQTYFTIIYSIQILSSGNLGNSYCTFLSHPQYF